MKLVAAAALGSETNAGDIVSFESDGKRHDFSIVGRRWIVSEDGALLELTLDNPPRRGF